MRHLEVTDSDIIRSVGFSTKDYKGTEFGSMEVVFKSTPDVVYRYEQVRVGTFVAMLSADSIGKAFHDLFRKVKHPFTKSQRDVPTLVKRAPRLEDDDLDTPREVERLEAVLRYIGQNCENAETVRDHVSRALRGKSVP